MVGWGAGRTRKRVGWHPIESPTSASQTGWGWELKDVVTSSPAYFPGRSVFKKASRLNAQNIYHHKVDASVLECGPIGVGVLEGTGHA